jgi:hypothetical protein
MQNDDEDTVIEKTVRLAQLNVPVDHAIIMATKLPPSSYIDVLIMYMQAYLLSEDDKKEIERLADDIRKFVEPVPKKEIAALLKEISNKF